MAHRRLMWQLYPSILAIAIAIIILVSWYYSQTLKHFYYDQMSAELYDRTIIASGRFTELLASEEYATIDSLAKVIGAKSETRVTLVLPSGTVIGDSEENPLVMDNHGRRPELIEALNGRRGESRRYSSTVQKNMMYLAIPLKKDREIIGAIRMSFPVTAIERELASFNQKIILGGLVAAILAAIVSYFIARRVSRPLELLKDGAERFAAGELQYRLPVPVSREFAALAEAMNQMATQLHERINTVINQRNEQEAILSGMVEGVLAIDTEERFIMLNNAAKRLLGIKTGDVIGRVLHEIVRNTDLQKAIAQIIESDRTIETEIILHAEDERYLQVHGTRLRDNSNNAIGALIVLNDVTRLRRLENIRREFVANVSHELKTPITSIKGFVETLQDGALEDKETAHRFLGIVGRQADRLNAIITDLLTLSQVEQQVEKKEIQLRDEDILPVINSAVEICELKAEVKKINIDVDCEKNLKAKINAPLLEQALVNLIDNAIKHSNDGGQVRVKAAADGGRVSISVIDQGRGIKKAHLPRLFERFYRVDKAGSQELGGTGLGLAIVKHIILLHEGTVDVRSTFGQGSEFKITLASS